MNKMTCVTALLLLAAPAFAQNSLSIQPPFTAAEIKMMDSLAVLFMQKRSNDIEKSIAETPGMRVTLAYDDAKAVILKRREWAGTLKDEVMINGQRYVPYVEPTPTFEIPNPAYNANAITIQPFEVKP